MDKIEDWKCPICGSVGYELLFSVDDLKLFECNDCTVVFSDPAKFNHNYNPNGGKDEEMRSV